MPHAWLDGRGRDPASGGCARKGEAVRCPFCRHPDSRVVDSREVEEGAAIRRRRACPSCGRRFTTMEEASLRVRKRSGATEPFSRAKVLAGVRKACQGRPVRPHDLDLLAEQVEEAVRATGAAEVPSEDVGRAILGPLRDLDEVAYLRFASVYLSFESLANFEEAIAALRAQAADPARSADRAGSAEHAAASAGVAAGSTAAEG